MQDNYELRAKELHYGSIVVDTHNDTMMKVINPITWLPRKSLGDETSLHIDIPKLQRGGMKVAFFAAFTQGSKRNPYERSNSMLLALINALHWTVANNANRVELAGRHGDIVEIINKGKIAIIPSIEGAYSLNEENAIGLLEQYYDLGVRCIALQWNYSNALGEGTHRKYKKGGSSSGGLTALGRAVVKEMNRLGMVVDVSHMAEPTFWDTIEASEAPIIASHSGVYSLKNHPRNLTDKQLKALAAKGGVVQIVFCQSFLADGAASVADVVNHIDYVVKLVGVDYVGLGSDFDGAKMPKDLPDASYLYRITEELVKRGYSDVDIKKILGENSLRLFKNVEAHGSQLTISNEALPGIHIAFREAGPLNSSASKLRAAVQLSEAANIDPESIKAVLDGIPYSAAYDAAEGELYFNIPHQLGEKFHAITFKAADFSGATARSTTLFHTNKNWFTLGRYSQKK